jgi:hypothetical protein
MEIEAKIIPRKQIFYQMDTQKAFSGALTQSTANKSRRPADA